jgi:multidrug efflux pump subunit AcrB
LEDRVTETAEVWSRARDHLDDVQAQLPAGVLASQFDDDRGYAFTVIYALTWDGPGEVDLTVLGRYAEELETRLRGVSGTDLVRIYGQPQEEVLVEMDAQSLSRLRLSADQVSAAILAADAKVSAGALDGPSNRIQIEVSGELDSVQRVQEIPLIVSPEGETIRVGDVARVRIEPRDPADEITLIDGQPGVVVGTRMLPDLRIDQWSRRVDATVDEFRQAASDNVAIHAIFDQNRYTAERLGGLMDNVYVGFGLIVLVLLITLGIRSALIVALALPLTALFTLFAMKLFGLPIHQMSVTGLVVALGIMVDNAIVMVDTIQQKREQGLRALSAVVASIRHLWLPLLGSTLTTILAFAPIALMPGPAGEFVGGIALSVMFSLVGSYLISHTLIAGFAGRFVLPCPECDKGLLRSGLQMPALSQRFAAFLTWSLDRPKRTIAAVLFISLAGFVAATQMTEQFFPPSDRDMFRIQVTLPPQSSIRHTERVARQIHDELKGVEGIESQHWFIGNSAPSFYYNMLQNQDGAAEFAEAMVSVNSFRVANELIPRLQQQLDDGWPEAQILVRKLEQGPPFEAPIEVRLYGPNLDRLAVLGDEVRRVMSETRDVVHTRATLAESRPKVWVKSREEVAYQTGLSFGDIARQLESTLSGTVQGSILEDTEELPVRVRVSGNERRSLLDLGALTIAPTEGVGAGDHNGLPISALAELELKPARGAIARRNGQRVNTLQAYIRADVLPQTVLDRLTVNLQQSDFQLPAGYRLEIGGESSERNEAVGNLMANVGLILALLVVVVVLSFNSFRMSAIIFAVAAQAAGLGMLSVWAFGYPFGFTVIVGLMGLIGLAINAAIVILAELRTDPAAVRGDRDAIVRGVMVCTRHITSTTITTVGGFMPLILAGGGFWPPFAIAIAGGTVLTTMVSFLFAPAAFRLFARRRAFQVTGNEAAPVKALSRPAAAPLEPMRATA